MAVITWGVVLWTAAVALLSYIIYVIHGFIAFCCALYRQGRAVNQFPQDPKHWLMGHIGQGFPGFNAAGLAWLRDKAARHPRTSGVWRTCLGPTLTVRHPDTVRQVLKRSDPKPGGGFYENGRPWLGDGLILSSGAKWARHRQLITPAFHFDILRPYVEVYNRAADLFLEKLELHAAKGDSMEIYYNLSCLTLDIMLRCAFSYDNNIQLQGENHPYVQAAGKLADIWIRRTSSILGFFPRLWRLSADGRVFHACCDYVHALAETVIHSRKQMLADGDTSTRKSKYLDFLDILLLARDEYGRPLTDREIRDETDVFMFAGHDTTSSSITWTLYELARNQSVQDRCRAEVDLAGERDVAWSDLGKFPYLTRCIQEAQRLHTIVPIVGRRLNSDLEIDGKFVPRGTTVEVQLYTLHHNPQIWPDSTCYDPDRFLPERVAERDPFAFCPFSAGPRNCIGKTFSMHEQKVVLARILRRYKLEVDPDFELEVSLGVVVRPKHGLKLRVSHRVDPADVER